MQAAAHALVQPSWSTRLHSRAHSQQRATVQEVDKQVPDEKRKGKMRTVQELEYRYEPEMAGAARPCPLLAI